MPVLITSGKLKRLTSASCMLAIYESASGEQPAVPIGNLEGVGI